MSAGSASTGPRSGDDYALVLNAGSSSLKFCVYRRPEADAWHLEARGQIEGIGTSPRLSAKGETGERLADEALDAEVRDGRAALDRLAVWLRSRYAGSRVLGVGHRVVHGGARFAGPTVVTPAVLEELRKLVPLAPLHQPHNLGAIEAVTERLPDVPQVACFDTAFHRGQPAVAELVPLPADIRRAGVQRYGFHGLSYEYIASVLPEVAPEIARGRVIVAHLGSGASLCGLHNGKSVDSSFGFTALDGLCMGTRPGALDPGVVLYLIQTLGLGAKDIETILYKKSGLIGISGVSNDMRDLLESVEPAARLPWTTSSIARPRRSVPWPRPWAGSTASSSPPASARTRPRSGGASARRAPGWESESIPRPTGARVRASPGRGAACRPGSSRPTRSS